MKCPSCKTESNGRFCPSCGTPLAGANCPSCRAALAPGARFCTQCGRAVRAPTSSSSASLPWIIAAGAIIIAIAAVLIPSTRGGGSAANNGAVMQGIAPFAGGAGATGQPPPLTGTPREQADRLFNRIMQERSSGNEDQARFFVPMATQAYLASEPLDADGLYHLSLIQSVGSDFPAARATAERILQQQPAHLLGLAALAEAAIGQGDTAAARAAWQKFLDNLATERNKPLPEYNDHSRIFEQYEADAKRLLGR
jgi:hypothetical protein